MSSRFTKPPAALRRARSDNLTVLPASELISLAHWKDIANRMPKGHVLVVLPSPTTHSRKLFDQVAKTLKTTGHRVATASLPKGA